jgi:hypothetical protein
MAKRFQELIGVSPPTASTKDSVLTLIFIDGQTEQATQFRSHSFSLWSIITFHSISIPLRFLSFQIHKYPH